jgi:hypothetical protein
MDSENINSNKSNWLKKIKEDPVSEEGHEQSILIEDENEIEVELKDIGYEKKEGIASESEKEEPSKKEEKIIEEQPLAESTEPPEGLDIQIAEVKEEIIPDPEEPVSAVTFCDSDVITVLSKNLNAHFLLINIDSHVKDIRELPRYIPINNVRTLIGRYAKAHIILDDPNTIEIKHAKLIFEDKNGNTNFYMYPINNAMVSINGELLTDKGNVLKSGDLVKIGSADLIFFNLDLDGVK